MRSAMNDDYMMDLDVSCDSAGSLAESMAEMEAIVSGCATTL